MRKSIVDESNHFNDRIRIKNSKILIKYRLPVRPNGPRRTHPGPGNHRRRFQRQNPETHRRLRHQNLQQLQPPGQRPHFRGPQKDQTLPRTDRARTLRSQRHLPPIPAGFSPTAIGRRQKSLRDIFDAARSRPEPRDDPGQRSGPGPQVRGQDPGDERVRQSVQPWTISRVQGRERGHRAEDCAVAFAAWCGACANFGDRESQRTTPWEVRCSAVHETQGSTFDDDQCCFACPGRGFGSLKIYLKRSIKICVQNLKTWNISR